jgi:hypothetical protein
MIETEPRRYIKSIFYLPVFILFIAFFSTVGVQAGERSSAIQEDLNSKVEPLLMAQLRNEGKADFFIWMAEKADLTASRQLETKEAKGRYVYETLIATAERTQVDVRDHLDKSGISYRSYYIANKILVRSGNLSLMLDLAASPDISKITANHAYKLQEPIVEPVQPRAPDAVESNITFIRAPEVWALGFDGTGLVLAGNDTGLDWDHPAIQDQYRGWNGTSVDHNYNWWDATGFYNSVPGDGHGHGTHTTGTMVGDDGSSNKIGVAPGAQTIHCKNMTNAGSGNDATFSECFEFDLAPWDLNGQNPNPLLAPDAVNNSWGYQGGGHPQFDDEIAALQAAGILIEASAGNEGPGCSTLRSPGDYTPVLTTGSVNHSGGSAPGILTLDSSRGPSSLYPGDFFPDIMAPGEYIRSSTPGGGYSSWSGTSMSGPHTTALVALIWEASPTLRGDIGKTTQTIVDTAAPLTGQAGSNCGGDYTNGPNNDWGFGTIDAYEAVLEAIRIGQTFDMIVTPSEQEICTPIGALFTVDILQVEPNFTDPITLSVVEEPSGTTTSFSVNPVVPPGVSTMTVNTAGASAGNFPIEISGTSGDDTISDTVSLAIFTQEPGPVSLVLPIDGAVGEQMVPLFEWSSSLQAVTYVIEIATDVDFINMTYSNTTADTTHRVVSPLQPLVTYYWRVSAENTCGTGLVSETFSFTTRNQQQVLLVDDDDNVPDVRPFFEDTLTALGYVYDVWDTVNSDNEPDPATLVNYDIVIWFSGDEFAGTAGPGSSGEAALASWLDGGGCLFLTSQDYYLDRGMTAFMQDYLGVDSAASDRYQTLVTGAGSVFGGLGPYSLEFPHINWSDVINPDATAELAFSGNMGNAAVSNATAIYLTTYLGFPLEAIPDVLDRRDILDAFIQSCPDDPPPVITIIDPVESQTVSGTYRVLMDATDNGTLSTVELSIDGGAYIDVTANIDGPYYFYDWNTVAETEGGHSLQARAIDDALQLHESTIVNVTVTNNQPPVASFSYNCSGLACNFDGSLSSDPDGDNLTFTWDFGYGNGGSGESFGHTFASDGEYTVRLTVDDPGGLSDEDIQQVIVGDQSIHVSNMDGLRTNAPRGRWNAEVTITVYDQDGNLTNGVQVYGNWSNGASGTAECGTGSPVEGQCTVVKSNLKSNVTSVDFTVTSLESAGYTHIPLISCPDDDSNCVTITVYKDAVEPPPPQPGDDPMHIAGLTPSSSPAPKGGKWNATVTVMVHGGGTDGHGAVAGVTVSGSWSGGTTGSGSCVTEASGTCAITKSNLKSNVSSVIFTVDDLVDGSGTYYYLDADNHDGSSVVVNKPLTSLLE